MNESRVVRCACCKKPLGVEIQTPRGPILTAGNAIIRCAVPLECKCGAMQVWRPRMIVEEVAA